MPLSCENSTIIHDAICGHILVCLQDENGNAYFGSQSLGTFGQGSSPDGYLQDYNGAQPFEPANFQCFALAYTPVQGVTTDTITIQGTDANDVPDSPLCTLTFTVPTPCNNNAPTCPDPAESISYNLDSPSGNLTRNINSNFGFATSCTLVSASSPSPAINPVVVGNSITVPQVDIVAGGVDNHTINYTVDCGADGNISCSYFLNVIDTGAPLGCPNAFSTNYNSDTQNTGLNISVTNLGLVAGCTITSASSPSLTTTLTSGNTVINIPDSSLQAQSTGTYTVNYTASCNGESVNCSFTVNITMGTGNPCIDCTAVELNFDGSALAQGQTILIDCNAGPTNITFNIPYLGDDLSYFFPGSSAGSFAFVSTDAPINGFQRQTWSFTPKVVGCAETIPVTMVWDQNGAQAGCSDCALFTLSVRDCPDCGGTGGCNTVVTECTASSQSVVAGNTITLTASGCDCAGCEVTWRNSADNPSQISIPDPTGRTLTITIPLTAPQGSYSFIPTCCGCV